MDAKIKKKVVNFIGFLIVWAIVYLLISFSFWFLTLFLAYMFVYFKTDKRLYDGTLFLANEFDRHHNALADNVRELYERLETLEGENNDLKQEIIDLTERVSDLETPKRTGFDPLYDFIDEIEKKNKAP